MFTLDKKMLDNYIVSSERFLMYAGSKFGPSEQLLVENGDVIVHNAVKPAEIESHGNFNAKNFTAKKTWDLDLKS